MEGDTITVTSPTNAQIEMERLQTFEDRVCPLCSSPITFFFINFNEKLLMCENTECEFPFGYEDLQFVQVDNADNEIGSVRTRNNFSSRSSISGTTVSDGEQLYQACEAENNADQICPVSSRKSSKSHQNNVLKLETFNTIHSEMIKINNQIKISELTDKEFIKKLYKLQDRTGVQLLKPRELSTLKIDETKEQSEVKIDIDKKENDISVIKIELVSLHQSSIPESHSAD